MSSVKPVVAKKEEEKKVEKVEGFKMMTQGCLLSWVVLLFAGLIVMK